jgi:hypothetical protein
VVATPAISPPQIEVCYEEQWQRAIDLLAELLAPIDPQTAGMAVIGS